MIELITTGCNELEENLVAILALEAGVRHHESESAILQRRFHVASCVQCFERAKPLIKNPRPFCEHLWQVPYQAYVTRGMPVELLKRYRVVLDPNGVRYYYRPEDRKKFEAHLPCAPCAHWLEVLANGWTKKKSSAKEDRRVS